jgi:hypothetical protein
MRRPSPPRPPKPTTRRSLLATLAVVVLTGVAVAFLPAPSPVAAAGGCPVPVDRNGNCPIGKTIPIPGTTRPRQPGPTQPQDPSNPSTGTPDDGYYCEWHQYPNQDEWRNNPYFADAPPGSVFGEYHCFLDGQPIYGPYVPRFIGPNQGFGPAPPPPPSPAVVAADGLLDVRDLLRKPAVVASPSPDRASVVHVPTFVSMSNWQPAFERSHCLQGVCVTLFAEPALTFDPGEPDAETKHCEPGGTVFQRNGADPEVQAEPEDACAWAYRNRTGVDGRPDEWTAELTVTWTVRWEGPGGTGDTFDPISLSTTFGRQVEESISVVTDYSD